MSLLEIMNHLVTLDRMAGYSHRNLKKVNLYKLLKIKMKISYQAQQRGVSIVEHFLDAMIKSYQQLNINFDMPDLAESPTDIFDIP